MLSGPGDSRLDVSALIGLRNYRLHRQALTDSLAKLASGSRFSGPIGRFSDPAGLIASESLRATLAALEAETDANERALHQGNVADGALGEISGLLVEAKGLIAANADGMLSNEQKAANQIQIDAIMASVDRLAGTTNFLGNKLLDGSGVISSSGEKLAIDSVRTSQLGETEIDDTDYVLSDVKTGGSLASDGEKATQVIDAAIKSVATTRGRIGAFARNHVQARLNSVGKAYEQLAQANSMIADIDYAAEVSRKIREDLLSRATLFALKSADYARRDHLFNLLK